MSDHAACPTPESRAGNNQERRGLTGQASSVAERPIKVRGVHSFFTLSQPASARLLQSGAAAVRQGAAYLEQGGSARRAAPHHPSALRHAEPTVRCSRSLLRV